MYVCVYIPVYSLPRVRLGYQRKLKRVEMEAMAYQGEGAAAEATSIWFSSSSSSGLGVHRCVQLQVEFDRIWRRSIGYDQLAAVFQT